MYAAMSRRPWSVKVLGSGSGSKTVGPRSWIQGPWFNALDPRPWVEGLGSKALGPRPLIQGPGLKALDPINAVDPRDPRGRLGLGILHVRESLRTIASRLCSRGHLIKYCWTYSRLRRRKRILHSVLQQWIIVSSSMPLRMHTVKNTECW